MGKVKVKECEAGQREDGRRDLKEKREVRKIEREELVRIGPTWVAYSCGRNRGQLGQWNLGLKMSFFWQKAQLPHKQQRGRSTPREEERG